MIKDCAMVHFSRDVNFRASREIMSKIGYRTAVYRTERVARFAFPYRFSRLSALWQHFYGKAVKSRRGNIRSGFRLFIGTSGTLHRAEWPSTVERPLTFGNRGSNKQDSLDSKSRTSAEHRGILVARMILRPRGVPRVIVYRIYEIR